MLFLRQVFLSQLNLDSITETGTDTLVQMAPLKGGQLSLLPLRQRGWVRSQFLGLGLQWRALRWRVAPKIPPSPQASADWAGASEPQITMSSASACRIRRIRVSCVTSPHPGPKITCSVGQWQPQNARQSRGTPREEFEGEV